jgi:glyoxylase-like metal-dependent hydrolase (beta-lactamase superfamily II)
MHEAELRGAAEGAGPVPSAPVLERLIEAWDVPPARRAEIAVLAAAAGALVTPVQGRALEDEEGLGIPGFDLRAIWTPGHTPGHVCIVDSQRRIVFSGDHVLPTMHAGIGLGGESATNALADDVASLDRIAAYDDHEVLPGHGYRFTGLAERARRTRAHHLRRAAEVEALLRVTPTSSVWEIASGLTWTAGWQALRGFFLFSALHQTHIHRDFVLRSAA